MQQEQVQKDRTDVKKAISAVLLAFLSAVCALLVLISGFISTIAFSKTPENTVELFGYKVFYSENDIEGTDIKGGSLIFVKNTDDDEFYTPQFLFENATLIIPRAGIILKENAAYIALSASVPMAFLFLALLISELNKLSFLRNEKKIQLQIETCEEFDE
ncbi:MAG: hypothetical protein UHH95_02510 [Oscillospiraceae bacterium]|nr:hypothetical protein [Oscillospiraceae bacterium]